jgi:hypothetical protein
MSFRGIAIGRADLESIYGKKSLSETVAAPDGLSFVNQSTVIAEGISSSSTARYRNLVFVHPI